MNEIAGISTTEAILFYILNYKEEHGWAPTVREIQDGVGLSSTSIVHYHLSKLERDGRIHRQARLSRTIRVL